MLDNSVAHLADLVETTGRSTELDEVLGPVLRAVAQRFGLARVTLALVDPTRSEVAIEAGHGLTPAEVRRGRYRLGEAIIGRVAQDGRARAVPSILRDERFVDKTGALAQGIDRAFLCAPITVDGRVVGTLSAYRPAADAKSLQGVMHRLRIVAALLGPAARRAVEAKGPARSAGTPHQFQPSDLIGRSKAMRAVFEFVGQVAPSHTSVLLRGESGTGKELVANAIHRNSPRARGPFIKVNCAALAESVIESELFGHEQGAFTGATQQRTGRFELANGGTIFLDEIGDLSSSTQIKLLRVLQQREFERVGGNRTLHVDVRVIAATSRNLEAMIEAESFRPDLYYRLNVFPIQLPPLRERRADILLLADHFAEVFGRAHGTPIKRISTAAIDMLVAYHWPGNVRELENCIERAVLLARGDVTAGHHLPPTLQVRDPSIPRGGLKLQIETFERELVLDALKANRGNISAAARELGVTERIMGLRVARYDIDARRFRNTT
jgi:Nif-specific regulatory protein